MKGAQKIELLAPARDINCGIEAINHGADAVYIGAPKFGARSAAGNSVDDIAQLVCYAHVFGVRIYVAINTILKDEELPEVEKIIWQLYHANVDALIIQDMGITKLNLPPIPLHASTQTDNRTPEKIKFLSEAGFRQIVLARELSVEDIRSIHLACPDIKLEVFVHGALCVSFSGQCYASQACFSRSANRGECAQFCRLPFNLIDADGKEIVKERHLLSLKDMNRIDMLEQLLDAGVTSLKIEGRLKDVAYVKNVTAAYRQKLDFIFKHRNEFSRASSGKSTYTFTPQLDKSFNRGFTDYFLKEREQDITSFNSPKSIGEMMGVMKERQGQAFTVAGLKAFHNGDGACFIDEDGKLQGFRVNKVIRNKIFPGGNMPNIRPRTEIYRNYDQEFEGLLAQKSAERKLSTKWNVNETRFGFALEVTDEDNNSITLSFSANKEKAQKPQTENIKKQLSKLGNTPFSVATDDITISTNETWFIPSSTLSEWRRQIVDKLLSLRRIRYKQEISVWEQTSHPFVTDHLTYLGNVMNMKATDFYKSHSVKTVDDAFERRKQSTAATIMFCRHCIRYSMGWCPNKQKGQSPYKEPYFLKLTDGRQFRLIFDCKNCQMKVETE